MDTKPAFSFERHGVVRNLARAGVLMLLAGGVLGACGSDDSDDGATATTSTTVAVTADATTTTPAETGGDQSAGGGDQSAGGSGGGESSGGESSGGGSGGGSGGEAAAAPTISSFTTPDDIDCHNGNAQTFTAAWTTTGAARVTISIDGPGVYNEYPANGETDLPFDCSAPHTFLLTAYGADGQTATSSVTLQPRNVQPETGDDTEDV